jgi:SAM-dependent methyltransferase
MLPRLAVPNIFGSARRDAILPLAPDRYLVIGNSLLPSMSVCSYLRQLRMSESSRLCYAKSTIRGFTLHASRRHSTENAFVAHREQSNETQILAQAIRPLIKKAMVVVDVGAGTGTLARTLNGGRKIIAIEPSPTHFAQLSKSLNDRRHQLIHQKIEAVHLNQNSVDAVLFSHSLYHFSSLRSAIEKAFNWLKSGGTAIFVVLAENGDQSTIIRRFWPHYHIKNEFFPTGAAVKNTLREFTDKIETRRVTSHRTLRNEQDRIAFLSLTLEVPTHRLRMRTRSQFKQWLSSNVRTSLVTTNHEIIYCQKRPIRPFEGFGT